MKTYVINLIVDAKNTDVYDKVALNKYPIVVMCKSESELKELLASGEAVKFVNKNIKSDRVYKTAQWWIRDIYGDNGCRELCWNVDSILKKDR